jgi:hypothetical protein
MPIRKWRVVGVDCAVVPSAENVSDLMGERVRDCRACVVDNKERFLRFRTNTRRQTATCRTVQNEADDIGALLVTQPSPVQNEADDIGALLVTQPSQVTRRGQGTLDIAGTV